MARRPFLSPPRRAWCSCLGAARLVVAWVGYMIFTRGLGIGDDDAFDLGGVLSAIIGVVIVLIVAAFITRRVGGRGPRPV
jgi:hypothetical protein